MLPKGTSINHDGYKKTTCQNDLGSDPGDRPFPRRGVDTGRLPALGVHRHVPARRRRGDPLVFCAQAWPPRTMDLAYIECYFMVVFARAFSFQRERRIQEDRLV